MTSWFFFLFPVSLFVFGLSPLSPPSPSTIQPAVTQDVKKEPQTDSQPRSPPEILTLPLATLPFGSQENDAGASEDFSQSQALPFDLNAVKIVTPSTSSSSSCASSCRPAPTTPNTQDTLLDSPLCTTVQLGPSQFSNGYAADDDDDETYDPRSSSPTPAAKRKADQLASAFHYDDDFFDSLSESDHDDDDDDLYGRHAPPPPRKRQRTIATADDDDDIDNATTDVDAPAATPAPKMAAAKPSARKAGASNAAAATAETPARASRSAPAAVNIRDDEAVTSKKPSRKPAAKKGKGVKDGVLEYVKTPAMTARDWRHADARSVKEDIRATSARLRAEDGERERAKASAGVPKKQRPRDALMEQQAALVQSQAELAKLQARLLQAIIEQLRKDD